MDISYIKNLFSLEGKNAVVTGGSQGIGRGIAESLAKFGAKVTILGRNQELLDETASEIIKAGGECSTYAFDISNRDEARKFFADYMENHNSLDIFVSNAGYTVRAQITDTTDEQIDGLIATNLVGAITLLNEAAAQMKEQRSGSIAVVTSVNGLSPLPGQGMYSVTKFGLEGASKALASTLAEYGVRVNSIAPGAVATAMNAEALVQPESVEATLKRIPLYRIAVAEEIGDVVACVVSDAFRYMTGATIVVDGGLSLKHK